MNRIVAVTSQNGYQLTQFSYNYINLATTAWSQFHFFPIQSSTAIFFKLVIASPVQFSSSLISTVHFGSSQCTSAHFRAGPAQS